MEGGSERASEVICGSAGRGHWEGSEREVALHDVSFFRTPPESSSCSVFQWVQ
jgi:hypothetical protein